MRVSRSGRRPSRLSAYVLLVVASALAGCTQAATQNPTLTVPKLIIDRTPDGRTEIYVHSAFGDHRYGNINATLDNETFASRADSYSLDVATERKSFFLNVTARVDESFFGWTGRVDPVPGDEDLLRISAWTADGLATPFEYGLPYAVVMEKRSAS
jgi:hypothetical protein